MYKNYLVLLVVLIYTNYTFAQSIKTDELMVVNLKHNTFDNDFFIDPDNYYISLGLGNYDKYPKLNQYLIKNYKGVPANDSVAFYGCFRDALFFFDLNKHGDLSTENLNQWIKGDNVDTLNYSKVKLKSTIVAVIGFVKDKQFMIADVNRNKDFSDDIKYVYDINFRNNPYDSINSLNKMPVSDYVYEDCYKGNIVKHTRRFIMYPDKNNAYSESSQINPKREKEYFSILKFRDYWKGETTITNKKIEFFYHGQSNKFGILYVKPKGIPYQRNSESFEQKFKYKYYSDDAFDDTLTIDKNRYKIESIDRHITKLYLRKVGEKKYFGSEINDNLENFKFNDINNNTINSKNIIGNKKFTLIEFWGTWCGPCLAMTPKIVDLNNMNLSKLNIISLAIDENKQDVINYISKHKMNWIIGFIPKNRSWENPIIQKLKIEYYPTFILIDSKGKILIKGGLDSFEEIIKFLKN